VLTFVNLGVVSSNFGQVEQWCRKNICIWVTCASCRYNPPPFFLLEDENPFFLHLHVSFLCSYSIYSCWYHCFFGGWLKNKALQFAPRLKIVLSRALPILGGVKDSQRSIYANGSSLLQFFFYHFSLMINLPFVSF
jgi:hypothetical protein